MTLPPDAALHGVPGYYSWASGAASFQSSVPAKNSNGEWFRAMTCWGQVYIPVEGSPATNTRCQVRNVVSQFLMKDGRWYTVQQTDPYGAAYLEDYANNYSISAGMRDESANGGGISVIAGIGQWAGYNFHFWATGPRAVVNVDSIVGVFTTCEARLIIDDINKPDDRAICKNILQMGGDWWLNQTIGWLPDWTANSGIGSGRSKWVATEWQSFNFCTLPASEILSNPPVLYSSIDQLFTLPGLMIYPNPLKDGKLTVNITGQGNLIHIIIYSLDGVMVYSDKTKGEEEINIDRELFKPGLYIIRISDDDIIISEKLIVE